MASTLPEPSTVKDVETFGNISNYTRQRCKKAGLGGCKKGVRSNLNMFINPPFLEDGGILFDNFIADKFHDSLLWSCLHSLLYQHISYLFNKPP
jgi:hypothetical protein